MGVEAGAGDFGIGRQLVLRRETPVIRVVPVAEMPEDELGRRRQPALLDRPVGGTMAHELAVTVSRFTIASISAMRRCASSWRIFLARTPASLSNLGAVIMAVSRRGPLEFYQPSKTMLENYLVKIRYRMQSSLRIELMQTQPKQRLNRQHGWEIEGSTMRE